ncbi:nucleoside-diphosphate kinase [Gulosibacter molinativorax]|uniref:Nucleoside diphosphate kinase n=1 Tax=Gulosibacter molinativorax TaxID=256821 RepID=A0ABT7CBN9_9MICO|nr:nucleoside-diphosphate kinase [Gulosibacter molinativorax]MDJ1372162.1 nucleoside-diphosphate kinase [Gulosibacter molinativorax]QUY60967.1 Nucleoside diphosphate kinase [Gulosibacter molinativorax]
MSSQQEQTLVLVKPDGVRRNLIGEVLARIERKGYVVTGLKLVQAERATLEQHYEEHVGKPFYEPLVEFMMSGPIVAARVEGNGVIEGFRSLAGATNPTSAAPGTIRGDLGRDWGAKVMENIVHGSDSVESAERELGIWFA